MFGFSHGKKEHLLTSDFLSREVAFLGSKITKTEGFHIPEAQLPKVKIKGSDPYRSDALEIIIQKDNLRTSIEVPLFALCMNLTDFSEIHLKPVADILYTDHSVAQIRP